MMQFQSLPGLIPYREAQALQGQFVQARARDEIQDTVLFLEHAPVVTRGRGLQESQKQMPFDCSLLPPGTDYVECERGGDLTWHGPGQLVIYPIFKTHDIVGHIRFLERALILALKEAELVGAEHLGVKKGATGVWVAESKIASIGIAVKKWVTYHGIALNIVNDLQAFHLFSPCGFDASVMTSLKKLGVRKAHYLGTEWRSHWEDLFKAVLRAPSHLKGGEVLGEFPADL